MELLQLRYFCHAAETQSFALTAQAFGVPASSVSQRVRNLEKELGASLFHRRANRITLSAEGASFYQRVRTALSLLETAKQELRPSEERLNICINCNRQVAIDAIEAFKQLHPNVTLRVVFLQDPLADHYDVIFSAEDPRLEAIPHRLICKEQMVLAYANSSPLAQMQALDPVLLAKQPFLTFSQKSGLAALTHKICSDIGFQPNVVLETDDPSHLRKCVELGLGVAVGSLLSWGTTPSANVQLRPLNGYFRTSYLYFPGGERASAITDFYHCIYSLPRIQALREKQSI